MANEKIPTYNMNFIISIDIIIYEKNTTNLLY